MFGIPPWGLGLAGALTLATGAYFVGDSAGANRVIARDAKAFQHIIDKTKIWQAAFDIQRDKLASAEAARADTVREIYREVPRLIDRPVYRTLCVDADGLLLLDRAADAANGGGRPGTPPTAADGPTR